VIIAGAVSNFYWNGGTRGGARSNQSPMLWALGTTVCCHLGSVALGSFILALISFVRVLLEYVHRKTRESQQVAGVQWLCNCIRCTQPTYPTYNMCSQACLFYWLPISF
jgi:hypothetical protein